MEKLYFANKVIRITDFEHYAFWHDDQLGCHISNECFLDARIYVFRLVDGKYVDVDGNEYQEFTPLDTNYNILWCEDCKFGDQIPILSDCDKMPIPKQNCVGIANVSVITDLLKDYNSQKVKLIIDKYNNSLDNPLIFIGTRGEQYNKTNNNSYKKIRSYLQKNKGNNL